MEGLIRFQELQARSDPEGLCRSMRLIGVGPTVFFSFFWNGSFGFYCDGLLMNRF